MVFFWIKALHLAGFLGCALASAAKNRILRLDRVGGDGVRQLVMLDKLSGLSGVLIFASGAGMAWGVGHYPAGAGGQGLFWFKLALFVLASVAVVSTKPVLRAAKRAGELAVTPSLRWRLRFDLGAILLIAGAGLWLVHGM